MGITSRIKFAGLLVPVILMFLSGCGGGSTTANSSSASGALVFMDSYDGFLVGGVSGYEDRVFVAQQHYEYADGRHFLYVFQQDATTPQYLLEEDAVYLNLDDRDSYSRRVNVNSQWATVILKHSYQVQWGYVALVPTVSPSETRTIKLLMRFEEPVDYAAAFDSRLLVSSGAELALFDISDLSNPVLLQAYSAGLQYSSIVAVPNGFYAFNTAGITHVNIVDQTFTEIADMDMKNTERAIVVGNTMYFGGLSKYMNNSMIGKADITDPASPELLSTYDQIAGKIIDFSFDTATQKAYMAVDDTNVYEFIEDESGFVRTKSMQLRGIASFYVYNGYLYAQIYDLNIFKIN